MDDKQIKVVVQMTEAQAEYLKAAARREGRYLSRYIMRLVYDGLRFRHANNNQSVPEVSKSEQVTFYSGAPDPASAGAKFETMFKGLPTTAK
jgi:hypothetical protein